MERDVHFVQYMTEVYKNRYWNTRQNPAFTVDKNMTHETQQTIGNPKPLLDEPVLVLASSQIRRQQPRGRLARRTGTSSGNINSPAELHISSTPRRPLDESTT